MLDQSHGDGVAVIVARRMTGPAAEPLESLALLEQGEGETIGEVFGGGFNEIHGAIGARELERSNPLPLEPDSMASR